MEILIKIEALPPKQLSPNFNRRGNHWQKTTAYKQWFELVYYCAVSVRNEIGLTAPLEKASLRWIFYYAVKRKRDTDNLLAMQKAAQDSLVKAGIILADDPEHLTLLIPEIIINKKLAPLTIAEVKGVSYLSRRRGCLSP